jgi:hypothetical protein
MLEKSCNHYVIIEDSKLDLKTWHDILSPYYKHHHLHLISGASLLPLDCYDRDTYKKNGWHRSMLCKLLVAKTIQSKKYLILDSKNFFVRKQSLDDWPIEDGNGIIEEYNHFGWAEVDEFCLQNNINIPKIVYSATTPFMVDTALVREMIKFDILPLFLNKAEQWSSEFFLYSIFSQHAGNQLEFKYVTNVTFWSNENTLDIETLTDMYNWPNMRMFGLHRNFLKTKTDLTELVDFLVGVGLERNMLDTTLTQYKQDTAV